MTNLPRSFVFTSGVPRARDDQGDRELLRDLAAGKPEALGELYDRHAASLFRHALALARRRPDAEDLVHAVFVKLATTGAALLDVQAPAHYLHRALHTTWIDAQRRTITGERVVESVATEPYVLHPGGADALDIARALGDLPPVQRKDALCRHERLAARGTEGCKGRNRAVAPRQNGGGFA